MNAMDEKFDRIFGELALMRQEIAGLRSDFSNFQDRMIQVGFGLVAVLIAALTTVVLALA